MPEGERALLTLKFRMTKRDLAAESFLQYYTSLKGLVITVVGLLLSVVFFWGLRRGELSVLILPFTGFCVTAAAPVIMFVVAGHMYKTERLAEKVYAYEFHNDHFTVILPGETVAVRYGELYKASETAGSYLFNTSDRVSYVIPKRIVKGLSKEETDRFLACFEKAGSI